MQFRIRHLLIVIAFVAVVLCWWIDHNQLQRTIEELRETQAPPETSREF